GKADVHRAEYLDRTVGGSPDEANIDELVTLVHSDHEKAQMHALTALGRLIPERAADIVSKRPVLVDQLDSDVILTRFGALSCLALLAEHDPDMGVPVTDEIIPLLEPASDGGILEEGIRFVAAIAEAHPGAVRDAVPNLVTLLQEDPPEEQKAVQALIDIAEAEADVVVPVVSDLHTYIKNPDSSHRAGSIAVLGYVAKEYPDAVEMATPTMIDLLDTSAARTRANAAGVLADLAEHHPASMLYDLENISRLVDDDDDYAKQNAAYILARVAEQYPSDVEHATDVLIDALGAESEHTRISTCRALGYIGAKTAVGPLKERRDEDSSMEVQKAAGWALGQMNHY
ncbi:HEAT repeat domain-containing protein, partial [Salinadaptatus halalkaliphilus]|uniref:HEAT repeat domain-containing protein n=1 Tax=Salinadaptatus halalkaliphilus TaxID=2419781 RepID=UPI001C2BB3CA